MAQPQQMQQLAQLLQQTVAGNTPTMQAATTQLRSAETQPGFGLMLLELLREAAVDPSSRQAGAIYFKNYVRRLWPVDAAGGGVSAADRQAIKQHLLALMLQAPRPVQVQLAAGLEEISLSDYPSEWQSLLPEMVQHLKTSQDIAVLKGTMETAHTVFLKFRSQGRSNDLLREVKYTVTGFQETHLMVFKGACDRAVSGTLPQDQLKPHFELLNAAIGCFYSLNVVDLPEFFEDHRSDYFTCFLQLLKFNHAAVTGATPDQPGVLEEVKSIICRSFALYTDKYQEEFTPYLVGCVQEVWTLLVGLDQQEKNDQLVASGIKFLSSAAATNWQQSPFQDPKVLSGICEKVVFPNILLRDSDVELFEDNPLEYVRRDMEDADVESRRRSAVDLVKAMGKLNDAQVTEILIGYVKELMAQAQQVPPDKAERFKDACIYLCIAMAVRGQTQKEGVTIVNQSVNVTDFLTSLVAPELQAEPLTKHSLLRASGLKFITVFRNQLTREQIGALLPAICKHITAESPVVHSYAAICIEKLLSVKDKTPQGQASLRYTPQIMGPYLTQMVQPILQTIASGKGIPQNEYLMRCVARIFAFLKQQGADVGLQMLRPLAQILMAMAENPSNPVFNHNLFEAIASIVKITVSSQPDTVEGHLLPVFGHILEKNITDFLPYTFQILGLLLDAAPNVKPMYQDLLTRLLVQDLWRAQANAPGLIRLLRAYFTKHVAFAALLNQSMQQILERFQFLLVMNKKTELVAFDLLKDMYMHLPLEFYNQHLKTLMTVLLTKLQNTKSPRFQRDFVISCSLLVHRQPANVFPALLGEIQAGLLSGLLTGIWPTVMKMSMKLDERKVCALGLIKLMGIDEIRPNVQLLGTCCGALVHLLGLTPQAAARGKKADDDADDDEAPPENGGAGMDFEVSFSKLRNTDLPGAAAGLAPDVPDLNAAARQALVPLRPHLAPLVQQSEELRPLSVMLQ